MNELAIRRALNVTTHKQNITVDGKNYALHITRNRETIITDDEDFNTIYAVCSLDFFSLLKTEVKTEVKTEGSTYENT